MGSILRVIGQKLNVDNFDANWEIRPVAVHRKGDISLIHKRKNKHSSLTFNISNASQANLNRQIKDTIAFLKKHNKSLELISRKKTVDVIAIDFSFNSRIDRTNVEVQNDCFPAELIKLAGKLNISIWLTQWPCEPNKGKKG